MKPKWFRARRYKHFDVPVSESWASSLTAEMVAQHSWSPLIHWIKLVPRYKPLLKKVVNKPRDIMFASHKDACILSKYSNFLVGRLEEEYIKQGLHDAVAAYRSLGKSNYHFASVAQNFVRSQESVEVMCFDVTGFFDNLDHALLKRRLKTILGVNELSDDWHRVFRHVTTYRRVEREALKLHPIFGARLKLRGPIPPVATMAQLAASDVPILQNPNRYGVPQGTPISASLSNLYLIDFDDIMQTAACSVGGLYQRYSDDILVICSPCHADYLAMIVDSALQAERLRLQTDKTDRVVLQGSDREQFQYLGYHLGLSDAAIRPGSMSKQWRSLRRAMRKALSRASQHALAGEPDKINTSKLRGRLTHVGTRNFISYANRSADELGSTKIRRQTKRLHKFALTQLAAVKSIKES